MEAAHGATHRKDSYLRALYWRIAARRGNKKALFAVAHAILGIIYDVLSRKTGYEDLGENHFDERERQAVQKRLVRRLEKLGYQVSLEAAPPAA
jgi:transposase